MRRPSAAALGRVALVVVLALTMSGRLIFVRASEHHAAAQHAASESFGYSIIVTVMGSELVKLAISLAGLHGPRLWSRFALTLRLARGGGGARGGASLLYTSPSPRDQRGSHMPSSA